MSKQREVLSIRGKSLQWNDNYSIYWKHPIKFITYWPALYKDSITEWVGGDQPHPERLQQKDVILLTVLEARSPTSGCWEIWFLLCSSWLADGCLLAIALPGFPVLLHLCCLFPYRAPRSYGIRASLMIPIVLGLAFWFSLILIISLSVLFPNTATVGAWMLGLQYKHRTWEKFSPWYNHFLSPLEQTLSPGIYRRHEFNNGKLHRKAQKYSNSNMSYLGREGKEAALLKDLLFLIISTLISLVLLLKTLPFPGVRGTCGVCLPAAG